jgi:hypothetical protein
MDDEEENDEEFELEDFDADLRENSDTNRN